MRRPTQVLLTGASGFVGSHLYPALIDAGFSVVCASREPGAAQRRLPDRSFRRLDVLDFQSTVRALAGCDAAVFLVHSMAEPGDYARTEKTAAQNFARAAARAGVRRIVYLGGPRPNGEVSHHLQSRLRTGEILRAGRVPTIELQATMVIGAGSESWRIVRDLAARLPWMLLPRWLDSRSQPIYIDDVTAAICHALTLEATSSAAYALPGPETLSACEMIARTAALLGLSPRMLRVPFVTPRLSSYWINLVTRANGRVARQLVEGLRGDLIASDRGFWRLMPGHDCVTFDEAARRALADEEEGLPPRTRITESMMRSLAPMRAKEGATPPSAGATPPKEGRSGTSRG